MDQTSKYINVSVKILKYTSSKLNYVFECLTKRIDAIIF